jgi:hypothetical protein
MLHDRPAPSPFVMSTVHSPLALHVCSCACFKTIYVTGVATGTERCVADARIDPLPRKLFGFAPVYRVRICPLTFINERYMRSADHHSTFTATLMPWLMRCFLTAPIKATPSREERAAALSRTVPMHQPPMMYSATFTGAGAAAGAAAGAGVGAGAGGVACTASADDPRGCKGGGVALAAGVDGDLFKAGAGFPS